MVRFCSFICVTYLTGSNDGKSQQDRSRQGTHSRFSKVSLACLSSRLAEYISHDLSKDSNYSHQMVATLAHRSSYDINLICSIRHILNKVVITSFVPFHEPWTLFD